MTDQAPAHSQPSSKPFAKAGGFFGEPAALGFLAFTEAWERFSYYGMTSLLVLYMSQALFTPGHVADIAGFAQFRAMLAGLFGATSTLGLASQVFGLYTGFVYFTPVLGGLIADRWIGRRNAVMIGAVLMSAGHIAMAFDASFLIALALLITGSGLLKGNISSQVGSLYPGDDDEGRTRGFALFSMGINFGAVAGPLLCGLLAQVFGWHVGFGAAGALMLIGLATYVAGFRYLPADRRPENRSKTTGTWAVGDSRAVIALGLVTAITIFQSVAYYQNSNIALVWIDRNVDLSFGGLHIPVAWFNSIDPLASVLAAPLLILLWRWQQRRGRSPGDLGKIATGAWLAALANLLLAAASALSQHATVLAPVAYDILLGIAFVYYWPTLLALVSRLAPVRLKSTLMGAVFLSLFVANNLVGWLGGFYERMPPAAFWALNAAIAASGGVLAWIATKALDQALTTPNEPTAQRPVAPLPPPAQDEH